MKWFCSLLALLYLTFLNAQTGPFNPPPNPPPPAFVPGFLPIVIVNNSGLPDTQVNIVMTGRDPTNTSTQVFIQFNGAGIGTLVPAVSGDNGLNYSQTLAQFPPSPGGGHVAYVPQIDSALIFFSINNPLNIPVDGANQIVQPNFSNPSDPNFNTNFDIYEFAFLPSGTSVSADATAVSFFSIPLYGFISTPDPNSASNTGLFQPRNFILSTIQNFFASAPQAAQWNNLILRNGTDILRVLAPEKGMATTPPLFDPNYLDNAAAYGFSFINDIWSGPSSFYRNNPLRMTIPDGSLDTYNGVINADNTITFTSEQNPASQVVFGAPSTTPPNTTTQKIFGGLPLFISDTSPGMLDGIQLSKLFEEAIIVGLVPTAQTLSLPFLLANQSQFYNINPNLSPIGQVTGPWFDLYSKALHSLGLIFSYAFDDSIWPQVLLTSQTLIPNETYLGITIGDLVQTSSTVVLTSSPNPSTEGEEVTFIAQVSGIPNIAVPTGTVTFSIDGVLGSPIPLVNGTATFTTSTLSAGQHSIFAIFSGDSNFPEATSNTIIQDVRAQPPVVVVLPPRDLRGKQKKDRFATQTDIVNILTWKAPLQGNTPVLYKVFRDAALTKLIGIVHADQSSQQEKFKFKDHNRKPNKIYTYFVVSVDQFGGVSEPATVVVKPCK